MPNIDSSKGEVSHQIFQAKSQSVKLDRKVIPWKGEPSPSVSLLDMIKFQVPRNRFKQWRVLCHRIANGEKGNSL
jgi:hypothetical protein